VRAIRHRGARGRRRRSQLNDRRVREFVSTKQIDRRIGSANEHAGAGFSPMSSIPAGRLDVGANRRVTEAVGAELRAGDLAP
jgi:hypothetical protein